MTLLPPYAYSSDDALLPIGELAKATGQSVSALRFYEEKGLLEPVRTKGNQRRYLRADIDRMKFIEIAQRLGMSLAQIQWMMRDMPHGRALTPQDWDRAVQSLSSLIDARITTLQRTRDQLERQLCNPGDGFERSVMKQLDDNFTEETKATDPMLTRAAHNASA
ncbi:MerR family transcriptional regulator [Erythrobacter sp. SCSIO 43205]|uniref:MerR family transcriptional regulator n=1 Tax=Erythrobacter sp. SCSIO 43205 TaxID=2779361 RepID=UPI001CA92600|nr:MerR family transcriptional regulator [Erythrobacter sp. SCSIO 43205]UAB79534.1 MerR family transcriptional regulator [Erythrobacter sp. SCSIO 43205]